MKKIFIGIILFLSILTITANATDLVIESKTQSFTEEENKANLYLLPHENDRQFVTAFNALTNGEKLPIPETVGQ